MDRRKPAFLAAIAALALSTVMCSLFTPGTVSPSTTAEAGQMKGTIQVLQSTIDAMQSGAQVTAQAFMTEAAQIESQQGGHGTEEVPTEYPDTGTITGKLSYPAETIPPLRVVAFNIDTGEYFSTDVSDNPEYTLDAVPGGKYHVVAYLVKPNGGQVLSGGYSQAVPCGLAVSCTDHSLITFEVKAGETVQNINPGDWYAGKDAFPPDPTQ